jgi:hypothetical protein
MVQQPDFCAATGRRIILPLKFALERSARRRQLFTAAIICLCATLASSVTAVTTTTQ